VTGRLLSFALAVGLGSLAAPRLGAQQCLVTGANGTCSVNATTSLTAPTLLRLTVGAASSPFGSITSTNYDDGYSRIPGPTVTVKANQTWQVQISSTAAFWTAITTDPLNPARATKPRSDLLWATTVNGSYSAVSGTGATVGSGGGSAGTVVPFFLQSNWDYALDTPGNYSIVVTFTLVSP
jgi:hypothetical protein